MSTKRQNNQLELAFLTESRSEPPRGVREGTEALMKDRGTESPASTEPLMEEVVERENCNVMPQDILPSFFRLGPGSTARIARRRRCAA